MRVLDVLADPDPLKKFKENQAWTKNLIMEGVKDDVVPHISNVSLRVHRGSIHYLEIVGLTSTTICAVKFSPSLGADS